MIDIDVQGVDAIMARLKVIKEETGRKAARSAATKAMRIVRDAARAKARMLDDPSSPGSQIYKKIRTSYDARGSKREGGVVVKVGVSGGARPRRGRQDTGHWRLLEFGTENMRATPFMRPALESNAQAVANTFIREMLPAIDKAVAKAAAKAAIKGG